MTMHLHLAFIALTSASTLTSQATTAQLLRDLKTGAQPDSLPSRFVENPRGDTWFTAYSDASNTPQLFTSWGTDASTTRVTALGALTFPGIVIADDWKAYFVGHDAAHGWELWESDGSAQGTKLVSDLVPGPGSSLPKDLTVCAGALYHSAWHPNFGYELCRRGVQIADIAPGAASSHPSEFTRAGNNLYFVADDGITGRELWVLPWRDPKNPNPKPRRVHDIRPGPLGSNPRSLVAFANVLYFTCDDGVHGRELWRSNGVGSGTTLVKDVDPGLGDGIPDGELVHSDLVLWFVGSTAAEGRELWRSSGYENGTVIIADLRPGPASSEPRELTPLHYDRIAFSADDGVHGRELWWTQTVGSPTLHDLVPGPIGSDPRDLFWSSDDLYFAATDAQHGTEIWSFESIEVRNVRLLLDLNPGVASSRPPAGYAFGIADKNLIFRADDGTSGIEPWVLDAGALSRRFGQGCGGESRMPRLASTPARLGANVQFTGTGLQTTPSVAVVFASARPAFPFPLGSACRLQLDLGTLFTLTTRPASNTYNFILPIPSEASFVGANLRVGATVVPSSDPEFGFDLMNVVDLRLGR
ncbi:MAG: hypothetical protein H6832_17495 [Planctomycetes bacterium]|nr:hypothetical protein [Planctomycetota bacterium]